MKYKVVLFVFFKVTLYFMLSSALMDINRPKNPEFIKYRLIEGSEVTHDQNISLWSKNENSTLLSDEDKKLTTKIGKICLEDHECKWDGNNDLICVFRKVNKKKGRCSCPEGSKFNRKTLSCTIQRYKRFHYYPGCEGGIGSECSKITECQTEHSICKKGTCQCQVGYKKVNESYCEPDQCRHYFEECNPSLNYPCCDYEMRCMDVNSDLATPLYKCVKPKSLGDVCVDNLDCMSVNYAKCSENRTCICKRDAIKYDNICLNLIYDETLHERYQRFFEKSDISVNQYKRVDDRIPQPEFSTNSNTVYGEECYSNDFCNAGDYQDLVCHQVEQDNSKNFCKCVNGTNYDDVQKRCTVERHEILEDIIRETIKKEYYRRTHIEINGVSYSIYNGNCVIDADCEKLENGICQNNYCSCKEGWNTVNKTFCEFPIGKIFTRCDLTKISCTSKEDCFVENSICNKTFCNCDEEDYYKNGKCTPRKNGVGSPCKCEQSCRGLKYGVCNQDMCECEENYKEKGGRCAGEHGQPCDKNDDCFADNAMCRSKTCGCKDSFIPSGDGCVEGEITINFPCSQKETCQAIKHSECKNETCQCIDGYKELDNQCLALIGKHCDVPNDCYVQNADCSEGKCRCGNDYYYYHGDQNCYLMSKEINDSCEHEQGCQRIKNTQCKNGKCQCQEGYKELNKTCRALIGKHCKVPNDCYAQNADCIEGNCRCGNDYDYYSDQNCHRMKREINDSCEHKEACQRIKNTECKNGTCQCQEGYKELNKECRALIGAHCDVPNDCYAQNAYCIEEKCRCGNDYYYSYYDQNCYLIREEINDSCEHEDACQRIKNTECKNGTCQCKEGYKELNKECQALIGAHCDVPNDCYAQNAYCIEGKCRCGNDYYYSYYDQNCYLIREEINDPCQHEEACQRIKNTECKNGTCQCQEGYKELNKECRALIGAHCDVPNDCYAQNAHCIEEMCRCGNDYYYSYDDQNCYLISEEINDSCEHEEGCQRIKNTECRNGKCQCQEGYKELNKECRALFSQRCRVSNDCYAQNADCIQEKCRCGIDYYYYYDHNCHRMKRDINDSCEHEEACQRIKNTECRNGKCQCQEGYKELNKECRALFSQRCHVSNDCYAQNADCIQEKCRCGIDYYYYYDHNCHRLKRDINDSCEHEEACQRIKNTECRNGKCQCQQGYEELNKECRALIGERCDVSNDCYAQNADCSEGKCRCGYDYYYYYYDQNCYLISEEINDPCQHEEACQRIKNTECKNGKCQCQEGYEELNKECRALIGERCDVSNDCYAQNADCIEEKCRCGYDYYYYYYDQNCYLISEEINDPCQHEEACQRIKNTECRNGKCQCQQGYEELNKECRALIGERCDVSNDCYAQNADCIEEKCRCRNDYYFHEQNCHRMKREINDLCEHEEACQRLKNTECKNGKCQCLPQYKERVGNCLGGYQTPCETSKDCFADNATCKNSKCDCPDKYYYENDHCHEEAIKADDACHSEKACKNIKNTSCINNKCRCKENFVEADGSCLPLASIAVISADPNDFSANADYACPNGFYFQNGYCLHADGSSCSSKSDWFCTFSTFRSSFFALKEQLIDFKRRMACKALIVFNFFNKNYNPC